MRRVGTLVEISALIPELAPGKGAFAVAAAHKALEWVMVRVPFGLLSASPDDGLCQLELFFADNGFVHPFDNNPVLFLL